MKTIEEKPGKLTIQTSLVAAKLEVVERLHFGGHVDDKWCAGEHQVIGLLRNAGAITSPAEGVDEYSEEAKAVVDACRRFFGDVRALGSAARASHPTGELLLVLVPAASEPTEQSAPRSRSARGAPSDG